mgnify:CR=1 FL=1
MTVSKAFFLFATKALCFAFLLGLIHYFIDQRLSVTLPFPEIIKMYGFVFFLTNAAYLIMLLVGRRDFDKIGFTFLGLVMIKMMMSFVFLYPLLKSSNYADNEVVLNFFAIYLLSVFFEAKEAYSLIRKAPFLQ